jgi:hypothetical protein
VEFDDIIDALRALDRVTANIDNPKPRYRKVRKHRRPHVFGRKDAPGGDDCGPSLN